MAAAPETTGLCGVCLSTFQAMDQDKIVNHHQDSDSNGHSFCKICLENAPRAGIVRCPFPGCDEDIASAEETAEKTHSLGILLTRMIINFQFFITLEDPGTRIFNLINSITTHLKPVGETQQIIQQINSTPSRGPDLIHVLEYMSPNCQEKTLLRENLSEEELDTLTKIQENADKRFLGQQSKKFQQTPRPNLGHRNNNRLG